jgi:hypothetical protein
MDLRNPSLKPATAGHLQVRVAVPEIVALVLFGPVAVMVTGEEVELLQVARP